MGPTTRQVLNQFNTASFINFVEELTDIKGLIPDPHYHGGGLHTIERGGHLNIHADFNRHARLNLDRRINALLYLNEGWKDEWGGHIELWDETMTKAVRKVAPEFNRLVIFAITDTAFHGHPEPLACPPDRKRRSLALYYYSNGRPESEKTAPHQTLWRSGTGDGANQESKKGKGGIQPMATKLARKLGLGSDPPEPATPQRRRRAMSIELHPKTALALEERHESSVPRLCRSSRAVPFDLVGDQ